MRTASATNGSLRRPALHTAVIFSVLFVMIANTAAFAMATHQSLPMIPGAEPVEYTSLRDDSAVLTFAEPILPESLASTAPVVQKPGVSLVDPERVLGAYRLPADSTIESLSAQLALTGAVSNASQYRNGQLWRATFKQQHGKPIMLLLIDGSHPSFERDQAPELRPAKHQYLIFYSMQ